MGKMKEQNTEQEEKEVTEENTVIEAPENITGDTPANEIQIANAEEQEQEQEQEAQSVDNVVNEEEFEENTSNEPAASIDAPDDITGDAPVNDMQKETAEVKYKAKACIYYGNKKIMPGEILSGVEANTIHSLLKNGFIELV